MRKNKGVTLIALVVTIIVLLILAAVSIATLTGENGILSQASKAGEETKRANAEEQVELAVLSSYDDMGNLDIEMLNDNLSKIEGLTYNGGKITEENRIKKLADIVNLDGYDIYIQDNGETDTVSKDVEIWYNYTEKRWANVETKDGSMWVWIPRYAYKINEADKTFDIKFLIGTTDYYYDENGKRQKAERITSKEETADTKNKYYVHPAFTDESNEKIEYSNGGWDKELKGIWVAKFEAGYAGGNISKFKEGATSEETEAKATDLKYSQSTIW